MKIGLSSAAYYGQLETDEAAAHIAEQLPRHVGAPAGHAV